MTTKETCALGDAHNERPTPTGNWPERQYMGRDAEADLLAGEIRRFEATPSPELLFRRTDHHAEEGNHRVTAGLYAYALKNRVPLVGIDHGTAGYAKTLHEAIADNVPITTTAQFSAIADSIDVRLYLLALDGPETNRPSGLVASTRSAMDRLMEASATLRAGAKASAATLPATNLVFRRGRAFTVAIDQLLAARNAGHAREVHYEVVRSAGYWNSIGRHGWAALTFEDFSANCAAGHNTQAAAFRKMGVLPRAIVHSLTAMALQCGSYEGKTGAAVLRDAGHHQLANRPDNELWLEVGCRMEPWKKNLVDAPAAFQRRAIEICQAIFSGFGLDLTEERDRARTGGLVFPREIPPGIYPEIASALVGAR